MTQVGSATFVEAKVGEVGSLEVCISNVPPGVRITLLIKLNTFTQPSTGQVTVSGPPQVGVGGMTHGTFTVTSTLLSSSSFGVPVPLPGVEFGSGWSDFVT